MTHCFVKLTSFDFHKAKPSPADNASILEKDDASILSDTDKDNLTFQPANPDFENFSGNSDSETNNPAKHNLESRRQSNPRYRTPEVKKGKSAPAQRKRNVGNFTCDICGRKFGREQNKRQHKRLQHPEEWAIEVKEGKHTVRRKRHIGNYPCPICQKRFALERYMKQHKRLNHPEEYKLDLEKDALQKPARQPNCQLCGEQF